MKHFARIREGVAVAPLRAEIEAQPDAWEWQVGRQVRAPAQRETSSIPLRGLRRSQIRGRRRRDVHESRYTTLSRGFPVAVGFIEAFAADQDARLGRAKLARLAPGARVYAHVDRGDYYRRYDRYHLVLASPKGSPMRAGGESVRMVEGELWWFDNTAPHEAENDSDAPRVHLIFDLEPRAAERLRSPQPIPSGLEDEARGLDELLGEATERLAHHENELVQEAVRLYLVGRERPERWQQLLGRRGIDRLEADEHPLLSTVRLVAPDAGDRSLRRRARAVAWALERIERGGLPWSCVAGALTREGGVASVARAWRREQGQGD